MKYSLDKYKYFQYRDVNDKLTIAAMSTYGGRRVKGYAKCDPRDVMDIQKGKELAAARCNEKIAEKRAKRAHQKYLEAVQQSKKAQVYLERMTQYYIDSVTELNDASLESNTILSKM